MQLQTLILNEGGLGFPGGTVVKNPPAKQEMGVRSLGWEDPLEKEMATHSSILAGKFHGKGSLVSYSPWGHRVGRHQGLLHFTMTYISYMIYRKPPEFIM